MVEGASVIDGINATRHDRASGRRIFRTSGKRPRLGRIRKIGIGGSRRCELLRHDEATVRPARLNRLCRVVAASTKVGIG